MFACFAYYDDIISLEVWQHEYEII